MINNVISSLALTTSLLFVALACFFWGRNAHVYPPDSLVASVLALLAAAAAASGTGFLLRFFWNKSGLDRYKLARLLLGGVVGGICIYLVNLLFRDVLRLMLPTDFGRLCFRIALLGSMVALVFFRAKNLVKFLNIAFLASIGISLYSMAAVFGEEYFHGREETTDTAVSVTLKKTPSIYLFWMESFHEPRVIDKYYGTTLVQDGFLDKFQKRGCTFFGTTHSNSSSTLLSMADIFSMRLEQNRAAGMEDAALRVRRMLGGSEENRVMKILKANGYFTAFISKGNAYFHGGEIGIHLDSADYISDRKSLLHYLRPLRELNPRRIDSLLGITAEAYHGADGGYSGGLPDRVRHAMNLAKSAGKPLFVAFEGGAYHTPGAYSWRSQNEWLSRYPDAVEKGSSEALEILDMIAAEDPDAVIVLLGDHGAWRLRGIWSETGVDDLKALAAYLRQNSESMESLADDLFNVIFAVRMPGYEGDFSQGRAISTVNVFRHVFAALNDDPSLLEDSQPNVSTLSGVPLVIDGKVISE